MIFRRTAYGRGTAVGFGWQYEASVIRTVYVKGSKLVTRTITIRLWRTILRWSW